MRIGALELLQGLTGSPEGLTQVCPGCTVRFCSSLTPSRQLVHRGDAVIPPLLRLLGVRNPAGALAALTSGQRLDRESPTAATCLVNLTSHTDLAEAALVRGVVERLMECVRNAECEAELRGLCVMVLANATVTEKGTLRLLQEGKGPLEGARLLCISTRQLSALRLPPGVPSAPAERRCRRAPSVPRPRGRQRVGDASRP